VLRAPSSLALNPAREGAATASLGKLGQGLTTLMGKNFFLTWLKNEVQLLEEKSKHQICVHVALNRLQM